jgi:hypothetical protein
MVVGTLALVIVHIILGAVYFAGSLGFSEYLVLGLFSLLILFAPLEAHQSLQGFINRQLNRTSISNLVTTLGALVLAPQLAHNALAALFLAKLPMLLARIANAAIHAKVSSIKISSIIKISRERVVLGAWLWGNSLALTATNSLGGWLSIYAATVLWSGRQPAEVALIGGALTTVVSATSIVGLISQISWSKHGARHSSNDLQEAQALANELGQSRRQIFAAAGVALLAFLVLGNWYLFTWFSLPEPESAPVFVALLAVVAMLGCIHQGLLGQTVLVANPLRFSWVSAVVPLPALLVTTLFERLPADRSTAYLGLYGLSLLVSNTALAIIVRRIANRMERRLTS